MIEIESSRSAVAEPDRATHDLPRGRSATLRSLGTSYVAAGSLGLLVLVLPHPTTSGSAALVAVLAGIAALGLALVAWRAHLPASAVPGGLILGALLTTAAVQLAGPRTSSFGVLYVWLGVDAFFFLRRRAALLQVGAIAAAYAVLLALDAKGGFPLDLWLLVVATAALVGALVDVLRARVEGLMDQIGASSRRDPLTGFLNATGFAELMERELERAQRADGRLSVVICDLDGFKDFNERHGHSAGEQALRLVADALSGTKRRIDTVARLGGEEFALAVPDTDEHGAYVLADRLRRVVRSRFADGPGPLTASFGVASFPRHGGTADELVRAADQAVYAAKQLGGDRTVIYNAEIAANMRPAGAPERARAEEHLAAVLVLAETLDMRDASTARHSKTVGRYAQQIARALGLSEERIERVHLAGLLHDIGKIGIPDSILQKPGKLTEAEWEEMRKHPEIGARILDGANLDEISAWVLAHHERPDGRGYPLGLAGDEIPLEAKILAVADSYEAMIADRVYKSGMSAADAMEELRRCAGSQFDPEVVDAFIAVLEREPAEARSA
ncbi:MAG: diguanylate cyclase [Thermoleophilaceae bacterium]|nr:diguanylate cyclase [Thermoleophilaceae bacterium]